MKKGVVIVINMMLIALWITAMQLNPFQKDFDINMTVEADVSQEMINEVKEAFEIMPLSIVQAYKENDWKVVLLTSFDDTEGYEHINDESSVVGLINFEQKTITIKGVPKFADSVRNIVLHELCHFADEYWGNISMSQDFISLYECYKDGRYITYSYAGVALSSEYESDIYYATSTQYEFFAETLKDYLLHPDYLEQNYNDIYDFYRLEKLY